MNSGNEGCEKSRWHQGSCYVHGLAEPCATTVFLDVRQTFRWVVLHTVLQFLGTKNEA